MDLNLVTERDQNTSDPGPMTPHGHNLPEAMAALILVMGGTHMPDASYVQAINLIHGTVFCISLRSALTSLI